MSGIVERAGRVKPASGGGFVMVEEIEKKRLGKKEIDRTVMIERAIAAAIDKDEIEKWGLGFCRRRKG